MNHLCPVEARAPATAPSRFLHTAPIPLSLSSYHTNKNTLSWGAPISRGGVVIVVSAASYAVPEAKLPPRI